MLAKAQIWAGLFWLAIGAYVAWAGRDLGLGTLHEPGSGFALFWIGLLMVALSLLVTVPAAVRPSPSLASLWDGVRWGRVLVVVGLLLVFGFGFERVGFHSGRHRAAARAHAVRRSGRVVESGAGCDIGPDLGVAGHDQVAEDPAARRSAGRLV